MHTALVMTSINIPTVLQLYRTCGGDVEFHVAGDMKSDSIASREFCRQVPNCFFYDVVDQQAFGYACSELTGWNVVARRNIATLEALKSGAEVLVFVDDDNLCMSTDYFDRFEMVLGSPFSGVSVHGWPTADGSWFDVGRLLQPVAPHRGFPHEHALASQCWRASYAVDAKVGVAAGICLGDPDISAVERIVNAPIVHGVSELLRSGLVVQPGTRTVFNSQNTAFLRELAPCFLMVPAFGRYDDIFASLIAQRVMRERNLHVHFGQPFCWQQRNAHNLVHDLKAEMLGMEHVTHFAEWLDQTPLIHGTSADQVRNLYARMRELPWMPGGVSELGMAWLDDCEKVL